MQINTTLKYSEEEDLPALKNVQPIKLNKTYPFSFTLPSGQMGEYCYYLNYGIDTYRSGCFHDCLYCFARSIMGSISAGCP